jgi:hypothetical protein
MIGNYECNKPHSQVKSRLRKIGDMGGTGGWTLERYLVTARRWSKLFGLGWGKSPPAEVKIFN